MNYRGVDFTLVDAGAGLWEWQFRIHDTVTRGKTKTSLKGMAARRVQQRIDRELAKLPDSNSKRTGDAGSPEVR